MSRPTIRLPGRWYLLALQLAVIVVFFSLWEWTLGLTPTPLLPKPSECWSAITELVQDGSLGESVAASLGRVAVGFSFALIAGVGVGFLLGLIPILRRSFSGLLEILRPIPPIAWIPMAVAIFGIGDVSAWFVIFLGAFFPLLTNTMLGVTSTEKIHLEAALVLGASKTRVFWNVLWPSSLPSMFAGVRVGLGFAWMCVVAAEMFAARSGLGYQIQLSRQIYRLDRVVAGMAVIGVIGWIMSRIVSAAESHFVPWRDSGRPPDGRSDALNTATESPLSNTEPASSANGPHQPEGKGFEEPYSPGLAVEISSVTFAYPDTATPVLNKLNLSVQEGEVFCILGQSGCGKSTLLRLLAGLENEYEGSITVDSSPLCGHRSDVAIVFQDFSLFPWMTVEGNIRFALRNRATNPRDEPAETERLLSLIGLSQKRFAYPHELSGGQHQRVAVARALATAPKLLLLDEPFSALDSHTREGIQYDMAHVFAHSGTTVIMVTHDIAEAAFMADRVAIMNRAGGFVDGDFTVPADRPRSPSLRRTLDFVNWTEILWHSLRTEKRPESVS